MAVTLKSIECAQTSTELTVWIRAGGPDVKNEITGFVQKVLKALPSLTTSKVLICTNENDTILNELDTITKTYRIVEVIFSQLKSFSSALNSLAQRTDPESTVLTISVGVNISGEQIQTGLKSLTGRVKVYGWQISGYGNDGSRPGRGWYNTAALIDKTIIQQMQKESIPRWVDNGVLENIGKHIVGGNEEIPIMVYALQKDPKAKFILNTRDPVSSNLQLGTGILFQEKLERKIVVGQCYMEKLHLELKVKTDLASWVEGIWASLEVIRPEKDIL